MNKKVTFCMDEIKRLDIIHKVEGIHLTGKQAAERLRLFVYQVRRFNASFREQGATGLVHGNQGRAANNRIPEKTEGQVLELEENEYRDSNDSHFIEELEEEHGLEFSNVKNVRIIFNIFHTLFACGKLDNY
jgi:hypothetical protein